MEGDGVRASVSRLSRHRWAANSAARRAGGQGGARHKVARELGGRAGVRGAGGGAGPILVAVFLTQRVPVSVS